MLEWSKGLMRSEGYAAEDFEDMVLKSSDLIILLSQVRLLLSARISIASTFFANSAICCNML